MPMNTIASAGQDGKVIVWTEQDNTWNKRVSILLHGREIAYGQVHCHIAYSQVHCHIACCQVHHHIAYTQVHCHIAS